MRASHYALALYDIASQQNEGSFDNNTIKRFVDLVVQNGHAHLLVRILKSFQKRVERDERRSVIYVSSAVPILEKNVQMLLKKEPYKKILSQKHRKVIRTTDETLVGGVVVRTGTHRIDASYKRALNDIYKSMTANI